MKLPSLTLWVWVAVSAGGCTFSVPLNAPPQQALPAAGQALAGDVAVAPPSAPTPPPVAVAAPLPTAAQVLRVQVTPESLVLPEGSAKDLSASVRMVDGTFTGAVQWSSSDDTIATVNARSGRVQSLRPGVVSVVATSTLDPSQKGIVTLTVSPVAVQGARAEVTPGLLRLVVGATGSLSAKVQLDNGEASPNVGWRSSDPRVATVRQGLVTAVGPGTATITAFALDAPEVTAVATVVVGLP